jgi:hypothetical protein
MVQVKREPVNFGNHQQSGHEPLAGASPLAVNVVLDAAGAVHRRPAVVARDDGNPRTGPDFRPDRVSAEGPIIGLHSTATGRVFAVDAPNPFSRVYELSGAQVVNLSQTPQGQLTGGLRPIFAETEAMLVIATGAIPSKVLFSTPASVAPLGGGPPKASHVIAHEARLLANDLDSRNLIRYSNQATGSSTAGHEDWQSVLNTGFFVAGARPDPVVALHENSNDVFGFGTTNVQLFGAAPKPDTYAPSNTREFGCSAPYSVVKFDQNFGFIDGHRRVVLTDGRDYQVISQDIQQTLDDMTDVSDGFGYRVTQGPVDALCWGFPQDGRTFVYQAASKGWSIWQGWNDRTNNFAPLPLQCAVRVPETGEMLVGFTIIDSGGALQGDVGALSNRVFRDDLRHGDYQKIVARVDTGYLDRGTSGRKLCRALRLTWKGVPSPDTAAWIQWRDEGGPWEHQRQIEIGHQSETILRSLGVYRRRQWRVIFEGSAELVLARAEEEFELLAV